MFVCSAHLMIASVSRCSLKSESRAAAILTSKLNNFPFRPFVACFECRVTVEALMSPSILPYFKFCSLAVNNEFPKPGVIS